MSTPNPLIPQGTFQSQAAKGASNVRIAVATIIAIHIVFFGGLLLQGCKRDTKTASTAAETNALSTNLTLPSIDPGSLFYTNANSLPPEQSNNLAAQQQVAVHEQTPTIPSRDHWQSTNLGTTTTLPQLPASPESKETKEYTVVARDTFAKIATANGTTVNALKKANPTVDPAKIRPGMKLQIPASTPAAAASTTSTTTAAKASAPDATGAAPANTYKVKAGDTLTKVAKAHGITVSQLRSANNLKTSGLKAGQTLKIPAPSESLKGTNTPAKSAVSKTSTNQI